MLLPVQNIKHSNWLIGYDRGDANYSHLHWGTYFLRF